MSTIRPFFTFDVSQQRRLIRRKSSLNLFHCQINMNERFLNRLIDENEFVYRDNTSMHLVKVDRCQGDTPFLDTSMEEKFFF